jgi:hypothetical protein
MGNAMTCYRLSKWRRSAVGVQLLAAIWLSFAGGLGLVSGQDPQPETNRRETGAADDPKTIEIVMLRVRCEEQGLVAEFQFSDWSRESPDASNQNRGSAPVALDDGTTMEAVPVEPQFSLVWNPEPQRLEIPWRQVDCRVASGKRLSKNDLQKWYGELPFPVVMTRDPERLSRDFSRQLAADTLILRQPEDFSPKDDAKAIKDGWVTSSGRSSAIGPYYPAAIVIGTLGSMQRGVFAKRTTQISYTITQRVQENRVRTFLDQWNNPIEQRYVALVPVAVTYAATISYYYGTGFQQLGVEPKTMDVEVCYSESVEQTYTVMVPQQQTWEVTQRVRERLVQTYIDKNGAERQRLVFVIVPVTITTDGTVMVPVTQTRTVTVQRTRLEPRIVDSPTGVPVRTLDLFPVFPERTTGYGPGWGNVTPEKLANPATAVLYSHSTDTPRLLSLLDPQAISLHGNYPAELDRVRTSLVQAQLTNEKLLAAYILEQGLLIQYERDNQSRWMWVQDGQASLVVETARNGREIDLQSIKQPKKQFRLSLVEGRFMCREQENPWESLSEIVYVTPAALGALAEEITSPAENSGRNKP